MSRPVLLMMVCAVLVSGVVSAADDDPIGKKLGAAKEEYEKATEKARAGLLADLKKKEDAAQKAGDLKTLEKVQAETKAFEDSSELPKSVPTRIYEGQMRTAKARLEVAYGAAIKQYTKESNIALAKATQEELDEFKKDDVAVSAADLFRKGSIWKGSRFFTKGGPASKSQQFELQVTARKGETFKGITSGGKGPHHAVEGTIKDGKIEWNVVKTISGTSPGQAHKGTIKGAKITIEFKGKGPKPGVVVEGRGELKLDKK